MDFDILQKWFDDNPTFKNQKTLDADIAEFVDKNFSELSLDDISCHTPKIIKLADLKEVINGIDKGEITISKGAEILNDIVLETESKQVKELYKKLFDLHDYAHEILQELIELKRDIHKK